MKNIRAEPKKKKMDEKINEINELIINLTN